MRKCNIEKGWRCLNNFNFKFVEEKDIGKIKVRRKKMRKKSNGVRVYIVYIGDLGAWYAIYSKQTQ